MKDTQVFLAVLAREFPRVGLMQLQHQAAKILRNAKTHARKSCDYCNGDINSSEDWEKIITPIRNRITAAYKELGGENIVFGGDPRGATVKLVLPSGTCNDWGKEGWCVPNS